MLQGADDPTLVFESRFESGNLRRAVQVLTTDTDDDNGSSSRIRSCVLLAHQACPAPRMTLTASHTNLGCLQSFQAHCRPEWVLVALCSGYLPWIW